MEISSCPSKYQNMRSKVLNDRKVFYLFMHIKMRALPIWINHFVYHKSSIECERKKKKHRRNCYLKSEKTMNDLEHLKQFKQFKWLIQRRETEIDSNVQKMRLYSVRHIPMNV